MLDNFEHVLGGGAARRPGCSQPRRTSKLLVTSRMPLAPLGRARVSRAAARRARPAARLRSPRSSSTTRRCGSSSSARAAAAADFAVTRRERPGRRGDLRPARRAAAGDRAGRGAGRALPPPALLRRLEQRLPLLTGGRGTPTPASGRCAATIDWSYDLLLAEGADALRAPRRLRRRLPTRGRRGGLRLRRHLRRRSARRARLARREEPAAPAQDSDGEPRFWMLETIREFALELLESAGELEAGVRAARRLDCR